MDVDVCTVALSVQICFESSLKLGDLNPEMNPKPREDNRNAKEADQVKQREEEAWVAASESLELGWSCLQGVGAPNEILLAGPSSSTTDITIKDELTRELEVLRTLDAWCTTSRGRLTGRCPVCEPGQLK